MTAHRRENLHRPFECLRDLLVVESLPDNRSPPARGEPSPATLPDPIEEKRLFEDAMRGVKPISRENCADCDAARPASCTDRHDEDVEVLARLSALVQSGNGFAVADTSEYIEGNGYLAPPEITTRLHRGDFSIQDHLDLHGLGVIEAEAAFEKFLKESIGAGKRAVLIIHGRGLSSPAQPVLKTKIHQWLTRSRWRKWVIAFTSARSCDGGAGASYVLLRRLPMTKGRLKSLRPGAQPG